MTEYRIIAAVTETGEPMWALYRDWALPPFASGSTLIAKNVDRAVLEKAIEHLTQGKRDE
jgi:hypothetical protein